jgi:hypothetical protein
MRTREYVQIDISHHVGAVQVTPAVGQQWVIIKDRGVWKLERQLPFNIPQEAPMVEGQTRIGSSGPTELHGSQVNINAPLRALVAETSSRPDASSVPLGSQIYDSALNQPLWSDGTTWQAPAASSTSSVTASAITDATTVGRQVLTATDAAAARTAIGVTANSSDSTLLARANHTGTQTASTISDFSTATDARITSATGVSVQAQITAGTTSQYYRGDKTFQTLDSTAVGLSNVDNTSDSTKNNATATLTNKNFALGSNTLTGTTAQFNTALTDDDFATLTGTQTLTNKTLSGTTPIATGGTVELYNTADQTTNYEKTTLRYNSNVLELAHIYGGTGTTRTMRIGAASAAGIGPTRYFQVQGSTLPFLSCYWSSTTVAGNAVSVGNGATLLASSGTQIALAINPTVTQTSTAGYTALLVNPTETSNTGSGTKLLADFQLGGVSKAKIDTAGVITSGGNQVSTHSIETITGAKTFGGIANHRYVVLIGASGAPTLPTAASNTSLYTFKNVDTSSKTILTTSSQTIEGSTTYTLPAGASIDVVSYSSNWKII